MNEKVRLVPVEREVLENMELTNTEKILYAYIVLLSQNEQGHCFMKTKKLGELVGIKERQLFYCLNRLKNFNYISTHVIKNKRYIKPTIQNFIDSRAEQNKAHQVNLIDCDWLNGYYE